MTDGGKSCPPTAHGEGPEAPQSSPGPAAFPYTSTQGYYPTPTTPQPAPAAPPDAPASLARPPRRGPGQVWPIAIGIVIALLALTTLAVWAFWGATTTPLAPPTPTPTAATDTPSGSVRGYLEALAAGDADAALGFALTTPPDATLLTDEVLAELLREAPIAAIEVPDTAGRASYQEVAAQYSVGGHRVTTTFDVYQRGGRWLLDRVAAEVDLGALELDGLPLTVNGVEAASTRPSLFPGDYALGTTDTRYALLEPDFLVEAPALPVDLSGIGVELTDEARAQIVEAAEAKLAACVKQHELDPGGCGFAVEHPRGAELKESSMRWAVVSGEDTLAELEPELQAVGAAHATVSLRIQGEVAATDGSRWAANLTLTRVQADLTGEQVVVTFA